MKQTNKYLIPFILVTSLFFLWGFSHAMLDVLNKHFQNILHISKAQSGLVQSAVYGAYFLMAIPAGLIMKRIGYRKGIIMGLLIISVGAFSFIPAASIGQFWAFLVALFVLACGLTCLETAANPYTTVLGSPETAESRINLAQSFNAFGWVLGPLVGGMIIFGSTNYDNKFSSLTLPYIGLGFLVLIVAVVFMLIKLPEIVHESHDNSRFSASQEDDIPLIKNKTFIFAVVAQFFYVAAQTGINSFLINYTIEELPNVQNIVNSIFTTLGVSNMGAFADFITPKNPEQAAALLLGLGGMGAFMIGRLSGSFILKYVKSSKLLAIYASVNIVMMLFVVLGFGKISVLALFLSFFFMSIMFPTIFSLGIKNLGEKTKQASSYIVMSIVGGALCPMFMGYIADISSMQVGFIIPMLCFGVVLLFAKF